MDFCSLFNESSDQLVFDSKDYQFATGVFEEKFFADFSSLLFPENNKVHSYCIKCKKEETFKVTSFLFYQDENEIKKVGMMILPPCVIVTDSFGSIANINQLQWETHGTSMGTYFSGSFTYFVLYQLTCDYDCSTAYTMFLRIEVRSGESKCSLKVYKVGQVPPLVVVNSDDANEYRSLLDDMGTYDDYLKAVKSHQQGLEAGAFCYLRRVLSKMIRYYADKNHVQFDSNQKTSDKLRLLEKQGAITEEAKEMFTPLYDVLSDGDHTLDEAENASYYPTLLAAIQFQLANERSKRDYEKKKTVIKASIAKIVAQKNNFVTGNHFQITVFFDG
jgi:hypothetical protein